MTSTFEYSQVVDVEVLDVLVVIVGLVGLYDGKVLGMFEGPSDGC